MNTERMIFIVFICSAFLLVVKAEPEKGSNSQRIIEILKSRSNGTIKLVDLYNNTKTNGSDTKHFIKVKENVSNNSKWILSKNSPTHPSNGFLARFKHKLTSFHTHKSLKLVKPLSQKTENHNYILIKEKLHMVLYDKHFSPKLSVVKLMYTIVDRFY
ncbi:hypothetical protein AWZ03_002896 [Drosophila navojoa]|uniref:Uncharacterized protein n=1 Tax=Drosophila navojoa TaxID=7232 RepID=A0A484BQU4_DRONA|nr:hypothetical protein AWZ03_002896 [Drosophila navojoa]